MISAGIRAADLARFDQALESEFLRVELALSKKFQAVAKQAFTMLVTNSPQWSGNFTTNWNYSVNTPDYSYTPSATKDEASFDRTPFEKGSDPAVAQTLSKVFNLNGLSWRDTVFITNATPDDSGGYLGENMESGKVNLRPVNLVNGKVALIRYTVDFIKRGNL